MTESASAGDNRRFVDRRRGGRRREDPPAGVPQGDESLFNAIGVGLGPVSEQAPPRESRFATGWSEMSQPADSQFMTRQAQRIVRGEGSTFERLYRNFVGARAVLGLGLVAAQALVQTAGAGRGLLPLLLTLVYAAEAVLLWLLPVVKSTPPRWATRLSRRQWLATIGFDLLVFSALHALDPAATFNYVALLVLPALMAGALTARAPAVATAAGATLMLLVAAWRASVAGADPAAALTPAALTGIGLFVVALVAGELSGRLAREEMTARGSLELARQQAQLNRLVIEEMVDGVLVVDRRARVRAANPAARRLLAAQGLGRAAPFELQDDTAWAELAARVLGAFDAGQWPEHIEAVTLHFPGLATRTLRLRARFTRSRGAASDADEREVLCVLFLEDMRTVQARTRQEKLAAMGRVSAGIAHEIRNPLAAIAQANALMREGGSAREQEMLTEMVADNVERLKRIVDDVMEVAPKPESVSRPIDAGAVVGRIVADWARTSRIELGPDSRLRVQLPDEPLTVAFDPEHLRRVLVNLLDNARRYASARAGAFELTVRAQDREHARIAVASDGEAIAPDVEPYLFEPFFSTRSRGTGLGLYICRELCERYGGSIDYWRHPAGSAHVNEFVVTARRAVEPERTRPGAAARPA